MSMQIKTRNSYEPVIAHLSIHRIEQSGLDFEKKLAFDKFLYGRFPTDLL
jgi:hypothetical protein